MKVKKYFVLAGVLLVGTGIVVLATTEPKEKTPKIDPLSCSRVAFA